MPKGISKDDWDVVHQLACDIVNASAAGDDVLSQSRTVEVIATLEDLLKKYGAHPSLLATIGDYLEDASERMVYYRKALALAKAQAYTEEIEEILDSISDLENPTD